MTERLDIGAIAQKRGGGKGRWIAAILIAALAAGGGWYVWGRSGGDTVSYTTKPAQTRNLVVTVTATGTVEPVTQVNVSSELSGTVREVNADYNDAVTKGQTLALLDTDKLEANVESARAGLLAAQAAQALAEATLAQQQSVYDQTKTLSQRGISSQQTLLGAKADWERAAANVSSAKANVRVAEAALKTQETNLAKAAIVSPIDGVVLSRAIEVGQIVASTLNAPTLFTLAEDLKTMQLTVDIDEADIGKVKIGDRAAFTVEAWQDRNFDAVISQLRYAPQTVDGVVTYEGILDVDNADLALRPGMTATAEITVAKLENTLTIPNAALRYSPPATAAKSARGSGLLGMIMPRPPRGNTTSTEAAPDEEGQRTVWVLKDGGADPVKIRTGATDGEVTAVTDGDLVAGDAVITDSTGAR